MRASALGNDRLSQGQGCAGRAETITVTCHVLPGSASRRQENARARGVRYTLDANYIPTAVVNDDSS